MEPITILEKPQTLLVGLSFFGDPFATSAGWTEENEIGRLWNRFMTYMSAYPHQIKHLVNREQAYEVHLEHEETLEKGYYEVFVGMEVAQIEDVPIELLVKVLPPATYAVFALKGQQITSDWDRIIGQWMSGAGYERAYPYGFELYDRRFKGLDKIEESELDVYLPIKKL
jgi:predicted transcriptional regulator YdeE